MGEAVKRFKGKPDVPESRDSVLTHLLEIYLTWHSQYRPDGVSFIDTDVYRLYLQLHNLAKIPNQLPPLADGGRLFRHGQNRHWSHLTKDDVLFFAMKMSPGLLSPNDQRAWVELRDERMGKWNEATSEADTNSLDLTSVGSDSTTQH